MKIVLSTLPKSKTLEQIFFLQPLTLDLHRSASKDMLATTIEYLTQKFDSKQFLVPCSSKGCCKPVTRCSVHVNTAEVRFWCATCKPSSTGIAAANIAIARSFADVVALSKASAISVTNQKQFAYKLIRSVGQAKGLPRYVTKKASWTFFGP